jgi:hypothetical protein
MSAAMSAREAALKILLAHFPNVPFLMRDIERRYGPDVVRNLPAALSELRERLESDLRHAREAVDTTDSASITKE